MRLVALSVLMLSLVVPAGVEAQAGQLRPSPSALFELTTGSGSGSVAPWDQSDAPLAPNAPPATHWKAGAIAGGVVVGLAGAYVAGGLCAYQENPGNSCHVETIGGALLGAVVGATIGGLIGGQFPK